MKKNNRRTIFEYVIYFLYFILFFYLLMMNLGVLPFHINYFSKANHPFISHFWPAKNFKLDNKTLLLLNTDLYLDLKDFLSYKKIKILIYSNDFSNNELLAKVYLKEEFQSGIIESYELRNNQELIINLDKIDKKALLVFSFLKSNIHLNQIDLEFYKN